MSKKRSKKPATSRMVVARPTEAPMMLTRPASEPVVPAPDHAEIARLAFAKFAARGYVHGFQMEDWLAAETELRATP
jgi:hypothetical protein